MQKRDKGTFLSGRSRLSGILIDPSMGMRQKMSRRSDLCALTPLPLREGLGEGEGRRQRELWRLRGGSVGPPWPT